MAIHKQELLRRLSFIKYLFSVGAEQSNKSELLCNTAILSFHDSIELFLQLACEHHGINASNTNFMDYFSLLENKFKTTQTESMKRFNKTRVNLKHNGTMTSKTDVEFFKVLCSDFLYENTPIFFKIDFDLISLIDLIKYDTPKQHLKNAEKEIIASNYKNAIQKITLAFWAMTEEYEKSKNSFYGKSPFFFGCDMKFLSSFNLNIKNKQLEEFIDKVTESISSMQSAIKILSLGFDYSKFTKFDLITSGYKRAIDGKLLNINQNDQDKLDDVKWCFDYVIECCINLQDFDYRFNKSSPKSQKIAIKKF